MSEIKCIINACEHPLEEIVKNIILTEEHQVLCDNGVGFKHIRTPDGQHVGHKHRTRRKQFGTLQE